MFLLNIYIYIYIYMIIKFLHDSIVVTMIISVTRFIHPIFFLSIPCFIAMLPYLLQAAVDKFPCYDAKITP